jgi:putative transposase
MNTRTPTYKRHRFPRDTIQHPVWLYFRFLSHRDIEDLLAQRGIEVSRESIRLWCNKFGPTFARRLRRTHQGFGDTFYLDEVCVKIQGKQHYLWRAVDQDGEVVDVFLQARRDGKAAKRFFKRLLKRYGDEPRKIVTDKLRSYGVAHRELIPEAMHDTPQHANNRAELSHPPTRVRERGMRRFKSQNFQGQAQRFLGVNAAVYNLFNLGRHLTAARHYRELRQRAFASWAHAVAA